MDFFIIFETDVFFFRERENRHVKMSEEFYKKNKIKIIKVTRVTVFSSHLVDKKFIDGMFHCERK